MNDDLIIFFQTSRVQVKIHMIELFHNLTFTSPLTLDFLSCAYALFIEIL